jgi:hypothetical protein
MFTANLNNPLTTDEAIERFQCDDCKKGNPCEWECVESATCSRPCRKCGERNWFAGDLPLDGEFVCLSCNTKNSI